MATASDTRAGGAYVELGLKDRLKAGLDKAAGKLKAFGKSVAAAGAMTAGIGGAVLGPLLGAAAGFAKTADDIATTAGRLQMDASAVSELQHAMKMTDVSAAGLEKGMGNLRLKTQEAADGSKTAQKTFADLGLSWTKLAGLPLDKQLEAAADAIKGLKDPNKQAAAAFDLFGKAGKEMLPLLLQGSTGIQKWRQEAKQLGIAMSDADVAAGGELSDNMDKLKDSLGGLAGRIGGALVPVLNDIIPRIIDVVAATSQWIRENPELVKWIAAGAAGLVVLGGALTAVGTAGMLLSGIMTGLSTILPIVGAVLGALVSPAGLVAAAIAAATVAWVKYTDTGKAAAAGVTAAVSEDFGKLKTTALDTFGGIKAAITTGDWEAAGDILWAGLEAAFLTGKTRLITIWEDIKAAMVEAFAGAAIAVSNLWNNAVEGIADKILSLASEEGIVGDLMGKVLGVDMRKEDARRQALDFQQRQVGARNSRDTISKWESELSTTTDADRRAVLEQAISREKETLAKFERGGKSESVVDEAKKAVAQATQQAKDLTAEYWLGVSKAQRESGDAAIAEARQREADARQVLADKAAVAQEAAAEVQAAAEAERALKAEQEKERAAAETAAKAAAEGLDAAGEDADALGKGSKQSPPPEGTFSSYALGQMFGVSNVEQDQLAELRTLVRLQKELVKASGKGIVWGGI